MSSSRRTRWRTVVHAAWLSWLLVSIHPAAASGAPDLEHGAECRANGDCQSGACAPHPDRKHYCRAPEMDCAEPGSDGLPAGHTDTADGRTWICRQGGHWRSSSKRANGARCLDDPQCASKRCRANPDGNRYCLAESLDCSDSRTNGVAAGYTMQILDEPWTCTRDQGWGPGRFSDFSDGVGSHRACLLQNCAPADEACKARERSKLRRCERLKAIEIEIGEPVGLAIANGRDTAVRAGVHRIPDDIRNKLGAFFPRDILNRVRYRVGMPGDSELLAFAFDWLRTSAFVMDHVIIFRDRRDALTNVRLWAHELEHVIQYEMLGIEAFAQRWILAAKRGTYDDDRTTIEGAATARAIYVCSHIDCETAD